MSTGNLQYAKILVADNNEINRNFLNAVLTQAGAEVFESTITANLLSATDSKIYDLIFIDLQMPELDALELTRQIRNNDQCPNVATPIVGLASHLSHEEHESILKNGIQAILSKPISKHVLINLCKQHVAAPIETNLSTVNALPIVDTSLFSTITGGNIPLAYELLDLLVAQLPEQLNQINSFIEFKNFIDAKSLAHKIQGGASYCGAVSLKNSAADLEDALESNDSLIIQDHLNSLQKTYQELASYTAHKQR